MTLTPCVFGDRGDLGELRLHFGFRTFDLDDQHRLDVERIAGMGEAFADFDRELVHIFHRDGDEAGADDRGDALARVLGRSRSRTGRAARLPPRGSRRTVASVTMPSWPSEPMTRPSRSRPPASRWAPPSVDDFAVERDHRDAEHVVGGHAIFQAMRAARIHADIAADRAGELRGRIGRVEEAVGARPLPKSRDW